MHSKRPGSSSSSPPAKRTCVSEASKLSPPGTKANPIIVEPQCPASANSIDLTAEKHNMLPPTPHKAASKPFRFKDLAAELRLKVYRHLLPSGSRIQFYSKYIHSYKEREEPNFVNGFMWDVVQWDRASGERINKHSSRLQAATSLFLVDKFISDEARAVLYGENTYVFCIDDRSRIPSSLQSPLIFGIFGTDIRLPLLRNFRSIEIEIRAIRDSVWALKRHRARLEYFIEILKEHSDDENKKSLLKHLKVRYNLEILPLSAWESGSRCWGNPTPEHRYGLEPLATLNGIERVEFENQSPPGQGLPDWYQKCLELCVSGKGGHVLPLDYPLVEVKKKKSGMTKRYTKVLRSTRAWYMPTLNWKEYAQRNGFDLPPSVSERENWLI